MCVEDIYGRVYAAFTASGESRRDWSGVEVWGTGGVVRATMYGNGTVLSVVILRQLERARLDARR